MDEVTNKLRELCLREKIAQAELATINEEWVKIIWEVATSDIKQMSNPVLEAVKVDQAHRKRPVPLPKISKQGVVPESTSTKGLCLMAQTKETKKEHRQQ